MVLLVKLLMFDVHIAEPWAMPLQLVGSMVYTGLGTVQISSKNPQRPGIIFSQKSVFFTSEDTKWHAVRCLQTSWRPTFFLSLVPVAMAGASRQQYLLQGSSAAASAAAWPLIFQVMMMAAGCFSVLDLEFQAWIFFGTKRGRWSFFYG